VLKWQSLWVLETLPQASAETSNTGSNRNEGGLYGFFTPSSRGSPDESVFVLLVKFVMQRTVLRANLALIASA
jgi:hypothetical protein